MSIPAGTKRFHAYIGVVSPPATFDYSAQQLIQVSADPIGAIQNLPNYAASDYEDKVDDREGRLALLRDGIAAMRAADAEIIGQFGGYWSLSYAPDAQEAARLESELSAEFDARVILAWRAMEAAVAEIGAKKIAVTTGYYRPAWTAASVAYLESAGLDVLWAGDLIDQGLLPDHQAKLNIEAATNWDYPEELCFQTCVAAATQAPECDAIVHCGAGMRTMFVAEQVEIETGKPLVSTDISFCWALLKEAKAAAKPGYGGLLSGLKAN